MPVFPRRPATPERIPSRDPTPHAPPRDAPPTRRPTATATGRRKWPRPSIAAVAAWRRAANLTATGSASSKATRSSNPNTSCCWPSSAASDDPRVALAANYLLATATARRRLVELSRRPGRAQRLGQGVLRPEARRRRRRRAAHAAGRGRRSARSAGRRRATASPSSTSRCSASSRTPHCPSVPPR